MPEFRAFATQRSLTDAGRRTLVDQAEILIEGLYVHLPLKRAMHAVDPLQRLRLLRHRPALPEDQFHAELQRIFLGLCDLHTNYILPDRYRGFAFLGVLIEQYEDDAGPHWIVSKVFDHLVGDPNLTVGAELTHWNGMPIAIAVQRNAEREAGSNRAARIARGLENMTLRPVRMSLPPDEDWVELRYLVDATAHQTRIPWRVFETADELAAARANLPAGLAVPGAELIGLDLRTDVVRRAKQTLFAPAVAKEVARVSRGRARVPRPTAAQSVAGVLPTSRPEELLARTVDTAHGTFGHLRIFTFFMSDGQVGAFVEEVARLLSVLPEEGLILDVRGNGGGYLIAAEFLLQFLTPHRVRPEPFQFINTDSTADLCRRATDFGPWRASIEESVETAAQFSAALPLYSEDIVNSAGQLYHGPVVLVTDALCYSATDTFAAGFQDNGIGPVLGVADNTGAGGANVLTHDALRSLWTKGPLRALPGGAEFRVALRRSLRVGARFGQPVEDLGVLPDVRHRLTRRDLLEGNADLMEHAAELLAAGTVRVLSATAGPVSGAELTLTVTTKALSSIDIYAGSRPLLTTAVEDGDNEITLPAPAAGSTLRLEGFDGNDLVAAQLLPLS
ncbi:S41 family peptidase [Actinophytocola sp.]|uniref:S41 family peptidase n=1 Tax=Actinophytocola sp. TaxID=1872138 RepID=UPI002D7F462F|nr:S41 family peptidase [Actinophytocola sp.]HET9141577.1 S41 family peptidase [Actinophytocola sp.]